jgi:hypothetical protein
MYDRVSLYFFFLLICSYHGTDTRNFPSIKSRGLLVPGDGNDIKVVHGSAYGIEKKKH